jgi:hypothetical protein
MAVTNTGWPEPHTLALIPLIESGLSASKIAIELNKMFNTNYSRNAVVGKSGRMKSPCRAKPTGGGPGCFSSTRQPKRDPNAPKPYRVVRRPPPRSITEAACAEIVPLHLRCVELEPPHCRWPYGDGPITFCGHQRLRDPLSDELFPYCAAHYDLSCGTGTRSEREAAHA